MYGTSPKVAAPTATARTKCRRSNLPSRRPPQHAQEAPRRTICNVVIVPILALVSCTSSFCGGMSVHAHTTHAQTTKVCNRYRRRARNRARLGRVCRANAPPCGSGGESRQAETKDESARMIRPVPSRRWKSPPLGVLVVGAGKSNLIPGAAVFVGGVPPQRHPFFPAPCNSCV